ncbi:Tigger transposable element-derived protein 7-like 48, partial [Homarus americanus]
SGGVERKHVHLSVVQKLELIKKLVRCVRGSLVCDEYGVKKQAVSNICKAKDKLTAFAMKYDVDGASAGSARKHMKVPKDKKLEEAWYKWFVLQCACGVKVRGVEIAEAANKQAKHLGILFKASDGWLWRLRNCHGICNRKLHSEARSAQTEEVEQFRLKLNQLIKDKELNWAQGYFGGHSPATPMPLNHEASTPSHIRLYQRRYLDEVLVVLEDEDVVNDTRGRCTLVTDFHRVLHRGGENNITMEDVETWLEENEGDPDYQMLSPEEIADANHAVNKEDDDTESSDGEESPVKLPIVKLSAVQELLDTILTYIDGTFNP